MNQCECDPVADKPATKDSGCPSEATCSVGAAGQWHLCDLCARLERFKRLRVRHWKQHEKTRVE